MITFRPNLAPALDPTAVRRAFPLLDQTIHGQPLVYLDSAATTQKPRTVLDALSRYYQNDNANVHRGVHTLGDRATTGYERARERVARFLNAAFPSEIVFVRGTTEAINLVAQSFGRQVVGPGDEVVVTWMEHHANIVPWQMLCNERGARLRVVPITEAGDLRLKDYAALLNSRTRIVALAHVSNVLGTVNPVKLMTAMAHEKGIPVVIDGAQAVAHQPVDVRDIGCDFYAFSGHKVYGPMGIGALYGRAMLLEAMPPWQGGGDMVKTVSFERTTYDAAPFKFEAGTPNVSGAVGLAAALDTLDQIGRPAIARHEQDLLQSALEQLRAIEGVRVIGDPVTRAGVISFVVEGRGLSPLDVGKRLDLAGIAVRTGHHCCQPLMQRLGLSGTVRASFALYNTPEDINRLASALRAIVGPAGSASLGANETAETSDAELDYPSATGATVEAAAAELLLELDELSGWPERYEYLVELGQGLPPMPPDLKTEENRVRGCQSTVYLALRRRPGTADAVEFLADSDGEIVRGLIAVLQQLLSGRSAAEVRDYDLPAFLARAGLDTNLTTSRRNGLAGMITRILTFATRLCECGTAASPS